MSRLPPLPYEQTDTEQRAVWDRIVGSRRNRGLDLVGADGSLVGPFHAMVTRPKSGAALAELGAALRFGSALEDDLLEIAILTVGAHWRAEFEFFAHADLARRAGVGDDVIEAIAVGASAPFDRPEADVVSRYATALLTAGDVDDELWAETVAAIGLEATVDLTTTVGYYTTICFVLNAFRVPLPDAEPPRWGSR